MAVVEAGRTPALVIEYLAVELVLNAVEAVVLLALPELRRHALPPEVLLGVKRVVRPFGLFFVLLHALLALLEEILVAEDLAVVA